MRLYLELKREIWKLLNFLIVQLSNASVNFKIMTTDIDHQEKFDF